MSGQAGVDRKQGPSTGPAETKDGFPPQDVVCISSIDWDFNWQGHQEVMSRLAAAGNRVLFIENTGFRPPGIRDLSRLSVRVRNWARSTFGIRQISPNLFVCSPLLLPFPYARWACWINRKLLMLFLGPWFRVMRFQEPVVWTFLPTRFALSLIDELRAKLVVYYCIADFEALHHDAGKVRRHEERLARKADLIFAQGERIRARCARWNRNVHIFPFGVNLEAFDRPGLSAAPELARLPRPVLGYLGGLHKHFDAALVAQIARSRPDWSIALVGPNQEKVSDFDGLANVHVLGARPHQEVPRYIESFDVGLIPYVRNAYTETVFPTKMNEYLILGKPVVSTPIPEVAAFNERFGNVVGLAEGADGFIQEIERQLGDRSDERKRRRIETARSLDWLSTVAAMERLVRQRLQELSLTQGSGWKEAMFGWYRTGLRRLLTAAAWTGLVAAALFYTPLPWWAAEPLSISEAPRPADAIVVFAGGVGESGKAGQGYEERVQRAVELYRAGLAPRIIISSGYVRAFHETEVMRALALSMGVPAEAILLESRARNTRENVSNVSAMLERGGWRRTLLISSPYHMRRARMTFRKLSPDTEVTCVPVERSLFFTKRRAGMTLAQLRAVLHEAFAIAYYRWKGWL